MIGKICQASTIPLAPSLSVYKNAESAEERGY